jgi:DNA-binding NarL/FixJ family response regulator
MSEETRRVLIADDQALVRTGFRLILEAEEDIDVVGEAGDGQEVIATSRRLRPDVILMDIRMPKLGGLEATRRILQRDETASRIMILTTFDLDEYVYRALQIGASGFLLKDASADQLVSAVRRVTVGDVLLAPSITRRLIARYARPPAVSPVAGSALSSLTPREVEVLKLVAGGLSNADIVNALVLSEATVKTHVAHILSKLGLRDRVQAVVFAYESGLVQVQPGWPDIPSEMSGTE